MVLPLEKIAAHHAWADKSYGKAMYSNAFAVRLFALELTGIRSFQFAEV